MQPPQIKEPAPVFSPWTRWAERSAINNAHLPGVYLLARWPQQPPRIVAPQSTEIIYIGEISDGSLLGRWQQFERAARAAKPGHRGGLLYHEFFGDDVAELYVAACVPQGLARELRAVFIRYLAARLLWEWARRWEAEPICNARTG